MITRHIVVGCLTLSALLATSSQAQADAEPTCELFYSALAPQPGQVFPVNDAILISVGRSNCNNPDVNINFVSLEVLVEDQDANVVEGRLEQPLDNIVHFIPDAPLTPGTQYTLTLRDAEVFGGAITWTSAEARPPLDAPESLDAQVLELVTRVTQQQDRASELALDTFSVSYIATLSLEVADDAVAVYAIPRPVKSNFRLAATPDQPYDLSAFLTDTPLPQSQAEALAREEVCFVISTLLRDGTPGPSEELCAAPDVEPTRISDASVLGDDDEEKGGCSVSQGHRRPSRGHAASWALLALGLLVVRRRAGR